MVERAVVMLVMTPSKTREVTDALEDMSCMAAKLYLASSFSNPMVRCHTVASTALMILSAMARMTKVVAMVMGTMIVSVDSAAISLLLSFLLLLPFLPLFAFFLKFLRS
jgi:hypothetical protein